MNFITIKVVVNLKPAEDCNGDDSQIISDWEEIWNWPISQLEHCQNVEDAVRLSKQRIKECFGARVIGKPIVEKYKWN